MKAAWIALRLIALLAAALLSTPVAAACPAGITASVLSERLAAAEDAAGRDPARFSEAATLALALLPCLAEPATPPLAARVHRVAGLAAYAAGDPDTELRAFAAARAADPAIELWPDRFVPGHPLQTDWMAIDPTQGRRVSVPVPATGQTRFDGTPSIDRPVDTPTLFQLVDGERVSLSARLDPAEPLPAYATATSASTARMDRVLVWSAVGAGVAAAGLYAGGALLAEDYRSGTHGDAELEDLRASANGLAIASGGVGAVGVGLLAVAAFTGSF